MFATIDESSFGKYKYCKISTKNMQDIFGNVVKRVFKEYGEFSIDGAVDKNGDWCGLNLLVEFSNGRYVVMNNSEWAWFKQADNVVIS